jgi:hypothetical protein
VTIITTISHFASGTDRASATLFPCPASSGVYTAPWRAAMTQAVHWETIHHHWTLILILLAVTVSLSQVLESTIFYFGM